MDRAPNISVDSVQERQRKGLAEVLEEWLHSNFEVVNKESADEELARGCSDVVFDKSDYCEDVLLKLVRFIGYEQCRARRELDLFVQQMRANLLTSILDKLKESGLTCFPPSHPSSGEKFDIVRDDKACYIDEDNICERRGNQEEAMNNLKDYLEHDRSQLAKKSSSASKNGNGHLTSGQEVPSQQGLLEGESEKNNNDSLMLEQIPAQQPYASADHMPQLAHPYGNIATIHQDSYQENVVDDRRISSPTSSSNNDFNRDPECDFVAVKKLKFLSQRQGNRSMLLSDWSEQILCIKCKEGGQLLTCYDSKCPISVHENCLRSPLKLDETGNFYCPFCSYFRAQAAYHKAKMKVAMTKKALFAVMCRNSVDGCSIENSCVKCPLDTTELRSHTQGKEVSVDQRCSKGFHEQIDKQIGDCHNCHILDKEAEVGLPGIEINAFFVDLKHEVFQTKESNDIREVVGRQQAVQSVEPGLSLVDGIEHVEGGWNNHCTSTMEPEKEAEATTDDIINDEVDNKEEDNFILKSSIRKRRRKDVQLSPVQQNVVNLQYSHGKFTRQRVSTKRYSNPCLPVGRRNKLHWTLEEEDVLKQLVPKFLNYSKGIPWTEILESGRHTFHKTRTPVDLKDKWRNISNAHNR